MKNLMTIKTPAVGKTEIPFLSPAPELSEFLNQIGERRLEIDKVRKVLFAGIDLGSGDATAVCLVHPDGRIEPIDPKDYFAQ